MHLYVSIYVVPWDEILAKQSTGIMIVSKITFFYVSLHIVPGDEIFTTHSTVIWFLLSMTLQVILNVVAEFETTVTQSSISCNLHGMAFHVHCLVILQAPFDYFIHQEYSFFQSASNLLSLLASLCLCYPPGIIFLSFMALSTWPGSGRVMLAFLWLFHPPVIIIFLSRAPFHFSFLYIFLHNIQGELHFRAHIYIVHFVFLNLEGAAGFHPKELVLY